MYHMKYHHICCLFLFLFKMYYLIINVELLNCISSQRKHLGKNLLACQIHPWQSSTDKFRHPACIASRRDICFCEWWSYTSNLYDEKNLSIVLKNSTLFFKGGCEIVCNCKGAAFSHIFTNVYFS